LDLRNTDIPIDTGAKHSRISHEVVNCVECAHLSAGQSIELRSTGKSQCIGTVLKLRLQAHIARAVERQQRDTHNYDQHHRDVWQDDATGVVPECLCTKCDAIDWGEI